MFRDRSLIPTEAVRLCALGLLAEAPQRYGALVAAIRHFTSRIAGPSLDLMGTSLELLRYEGLVTAEAETEGETEADMAETLRLAITASGRAALSRLLTAQLRAPLGDLNRLALLLKLRFLHHLPPAEQQAQTALIAASVAGELARLEDLRRHHADAPPPFRAWLDQDIATLRHHLARLAPETAAP